MKNMLYSFLILATVLAFAIGAKSANATMITGTIHIGNGSVTPTGGADWTVATGVHFLTPGDLPGFPLPTVGFRDGDFTAIAVGTTVSFTDFLYSPSLSPTPVTLWITTGGDASFVMDGVFVDGTPTPTNIDFKGFGTLFLSGGFDSTPGVWSLSLQEGGGTFSFSTTTTAVPEPGTIALLGIGLAGLVGVGVRKRAKKKVA